MNTTTTGKVRCGNHGRDFKVYHDSAADVRECYAETRRQESSDRAEQAAEKAYEQHLENRGYDDARAQEDYEARNGVLSFSDAWDAADPGVPPVRRDSYERAAAAHARRQDGPRKPVITQDGMYRDPETGEIFKVQFNRALGDGTRLYAKRLVVEVYRPGQIDLERIERHQPNVARMDGDVRAVKFEYARGVAGRLRPEWRMTMEEATEYGALYGTCIRCGRTLTREDSIERAMGPVCASKENWA